MRSFASFCYNIFTNKFFNFFFYNLNKNQTPTKHMRLSTKTKNNKKRVETLFLWFRRWRGRSFRRGTIFGSCYQFFLPQPFCFFATTRITVIQAKVFKETLIWGLFIDGGFFLIFNFLLTRRPIRQLNNNILRVLFLCWTQSRKRHINYVTNDDKDEKIGIKNTRN